MERASDKLRHVLTVVRDLGMAREVAALNDALKTVEDMEMAIASMNIALGTFSQRRIFERVGALCDRNAWLERENARLRGLT